MHRTSTVVMLALSGCLINSSLYIERALELQADDDQPTIVDTMPTGTTDTGPVDLDGDGFFAADDCDDSDATLNPDQCEICEDGVDQDCDGFDAACHPALDASYDHLSSAVVFTGTSNNDNAGVSVNGAGDFNGDGVDDLVIGASRADPALGSEDAGTVYLVLGPVVKNKSLISAHRFTGETLDDRAGVSVDGVDYDGDGYSDLIIGAKYYGEDNGAIYVVPGRGLEPALVTPLGSAGYRLVGESGAQAGFWVTGMDDATGDGISELALGAPLQSNGRGRVYLLQGGLSLVYGATTQLAAVGSSLDGEVPGDEAGSQVEDAGDVDGDGLGDLVVASMKANSLTGRAYVVLGEPALFDPGTRSLADAEWSFSGETIGDRAASSVGGGGDVDGDGLDDVIVGARRYSGQAVDQGAAYLITSGLMGEHPPPVRLSLGDVDARILGEGGSDRLGQSVSIIGDVDCDGHDELLIGADQWGSELKIGSSPGAAYLMFGPVQGEVLLATEPGVVRISGTPYSSDKLGNHLSGIGDVDGDNVPDFAIGAYTADVSDLNGVGQSWVVFGSGP